MLNTSDSDLGNRITPLFRLAFRPFFLGATLFSIVALALWGLFWLTGFSWNPYGGWIWWHAHEMLFGFASAVIVGFLLTAVQNWTGQPSISGWPLFWLFCLWLSARVLLLFPIFETKVLSLLDVSFLLVSACIMARLVIKAGQKQQLIFVGLLSLLAMSNAQMHWAVMSGNSLLSQSASHGGLFLIVMIIVVMGGRVIPFFTANGTNTQRNNPMLPVEILALSSVGLLAILNMTGVSNVTPDAVTGLIFLLAGISNLIRLSNWRPWTTFSVPLLWSLHAAYLMVVVGFFLASFRFIFLSLGWAEAYYFNYATILHSFTIGGPGLLIMAMMARVSLGHTGRELRVNSWIIIAFLMIIGAFACRVLLPILVPSSSHYLSYLLSITLWLIGFSIFLINYFPILTKARIDGKPG